MNGSRHQLRRPAPVVGQREREAEAQGRRARRRARRGWRGPTSARAAPGTGISTTAASAVPGRQHAAEATSADLARRPAQQREQQRHGEHVEARLRVPAEELQRDDQRQRRERLGASVLAPRGRWPAAPTAATPTRSTAATRARRRGRGRTPRPRPASSAPPTLCPSAPRQQERPERRHPQLQRADQPQRPPERQHVGGPRERREDRRLHVGEHGRPPSMYGFHSGMSGSRSRV